MHTTRNLTLEDFYLLNQLHSASPETGTDPDDEFEDEDEEEEDGEDEQDDVDDTDALAKS